MRYSRWIGLAACITLIIACFLPWTYYADIQKTFTGFFSEKNMYGKKVIGVARTTFVIEGGKITKVFENVKPEGHAEEVLAAL